MLISRNLTLFLYVTIFFTSSVITLSAQRHSEIELEVQNLIQKLGAPKFRERKQAVKDLIQLGYYARTAIQNALSNPDPEVRENAQEVWNEIKNIITPHNSKEVSLFIESFKVRKVQQTDWLNIMYLLQENSLSVMIQLFDNIKIAPVNFEPKTQTEFTKITLLKNFLAVFPFDKIQKMVHNLSKEEQKSLATIIENHIRELNTFEQANLVKISEKIMTPQESIKLIQNINLLSPLVLKSIDEKWLQFYKAPQASLDTEQKFLVLHLLIANEKITKQNVSLFLDENPFSTVDDGICSLFFHFYSTTIEAKHWEKLFADSQISWHQLALLKVQKKMTFAEIQKLNFPDITQRSQILKLIDNFFYFRDHRAIPLMEKIKDLKQDRPSDLYNENLILLTHFTRIGDFKKAQEYLNLYNKSENRKNDNNFDFFSSQQSKIDAATVKTLEKLMTENVKPEQALVLLNEAIQQSPEIATLYLQRAEVETQLQKFSDAKSSLLKASNLLPENALELRELIYLCFDLNEKDLAEQQIERLTLQEENINNCIVAAGAFEFFENRSKAAEYQEMIYMSPFGQVRNLFYDKKYELIPEKCLKPEEGDFQYLWGIMAKLLHLDSKEASHFMSSYSFSDQWPKSIAYMLTDKITPEELIAECQATKSVSDQRGRLTETYFYIACKFRQTNLQKAEHFLQKCLNLKFREYYEYISASALLLNLKK